MKIKIAIVDDQYPLIQSLSEALSFFDEIELVFTARHGKECLEKLASPLPNPDVIMMDIEMDVMNGIEATSRIKEQNPSVKIIMLSAFDQDEKIFQAILAGADGYLLKGERPTRIVSAIEDVMEGRLPMSPLVAAKSLSLMRKAPPPSTKNPEAYKLSPRETEVLEHVASGLTYNQIAEKLFLSPKTVRNHIENIYKKLEVHSKVEAVQIALRNNWFSK